MTDQHSTEDVELAKRQALEMMREAVVLLDPIDCGIGVTEHLDHSIALLEKNLERSQRVIPNWLPGSSK